MLYEQDPPPLVRYGIGSSPVASVDKQLKERDAMLDIIKQHLL